MQSLKKIHAWAQMQDPFIESYSPELGQTKFDQMAFKLCKRLKITSIDFYKRSFLGRNKSRDQYPGLGTKFRDQSLQASKWYFECKYRPENWITCSL